MPSRPPRPCAKPFCGRLTTTRWCDQHQTHANPETQRKAQLDQRRGTPASRGYDYRWRAYIQPAVLREEPLCRMCKAEGYITSAVEVDHIDGNSRNNDRANLRPLCRAHHSARSARDQGFARQG